MAVALRSVIRRSDTETASALGHASLKYVGRYVRKNDQERADTLESIFSSIPFEPPAE